MYIESAIIMSFYLHRSVLLFGQDGIIRLHSVFDEERIIHCGRNVQQRISAAQQNSLPVHISKFTTNKFISSITYQYKTELKYTITNKTCVCMLEGFLRKTADQNIILHYIDYIVRAHLGPMNALISDAMMLFRDLFRLTHTETNMPRALRKIFM